METNFLSQLIRGKQELRERIHRTIFNDIIRIFAEHNIKILYCRRALYQKGKRQRIIPLTSDVLEAMMDFNGSTPIVKPNKSCPKAVSITCLVREEVQNMLRQVPMPENFIKKEDIDGIIERCIKEYTMEIKNEEQSKGPQLPSTPSTSDTTQELEVTVEMLKEPDNNNMIVENFEILENRLNNLERRISTMVQNIPKMWHSQSKMSKATSDTIQEKILPQEKPKEEPKPKKIEVEFFLKADDKKNPSSGLNILPYVEINSRDDLYYMERLHAMNMLYYKKSDVTIALNRRVYYNTNVKPMELRLPELDYDPIERPKFLSEN